MVRGPRAAAGAVLGAERAEFARAFGRLGQTDEAANAHRAAGLEAVEARLLRGRIEVGNAAEHWQAMTERIGHFSRLDAQLSQVERGEVVADLESRLEPFRVGDRLVLPRAIVLVTAARPDAASARRLLRVEKPIARRSAGIRRGRRAGERRPK